MIFIGQTAFFKAAQDGNLDKCKFLVSLCTDINLPDKEGRHRYIYTLIPVVTIEAPTPHQMHTSVCPISKIPFEAENLGKLLVVTGSRAWVLDFNV